MLQREFLLGGHGSHRGLEHGHDDAAQSGPARECMNQLAPVGPDVIGPVEVGEVLEGTLRETRLARSRFVDIRGPYAARARSLEAAASLRSVRG